MPIKLHSLVQIWFSGYKNPRWHSQMPNLRILKASPLTWRLGDYIHYFFIQSMCQNRILWNAYWIYIIFKCEYKLVSPPLWTAQITHWMDWISRGWILLTLVIPWFISQCQNEIVCYGFGVKYFNNYVCISVKLLEDSRTYNLVFQQPTRNQTFPYCLLLGNRN